MPVKSWMIFFVLVPLFGCAADSEDEPFGGHNEPSDFDTVTALDSKGDETSLRFNRNSIVSDDLFSNGSMMNVEDVQRFFENTPYNRSSFLAAESVNGTSAAQLLVNAAERHGINPLMLVVRLQVEGSHIARGSRPSNRSVNRALGCGCFDGERCRGQYLGLDKQFECSAETFANQLRGSQNGTGQWRRGSTKRALDNVSVTPRQSFERRNVRVYAVGPPKPRRKLAGMEHHATILETSGTTSGQSTDQWS